MGFAPVDDIARSSQLTLDDFTVTLALDKLGGLVRGRHASLVVATGAGRLKMTFRTAISAFRVGAVARNRDQIHRPPPFPAARTIARIPALMGSGSIGQAATSSASSGGISEGP
jgi:hypothetical protein